MSPAFTSAPMYTMPDSSSRAERLLAHVRDIGGDFFGTQLGVTRDARQLLDVDRGVAVFLHDALGEQDRVFEVVAVPRHEGDQHVLAERELAQIGRRTVGQRVALRHDVTDVHQRTLVEVGVLVGTGVLGQRVDIDAGIVVADFFFVHAHHDTAASTWSITPPRLAVMMTPESRATARSMPVPTSGVCERSVGTA